MEGLERCPRIPADHTSTRVHNAQPCVTTCVVSPFEHTAVIS